MKNTRKKFKMIVAFMLVSLIIVGMAACADPFDEDENNEQEVIIERDLLLNNGTFYVAESTAGSDFIKDKVRGWSAKSGSISFSKAVMGAVELNQENFNNVSAQLMPDDPMTFPGIAPNTPKELVDGELVNEDNNVLAISTVGEKGSVYYSTANSVTIEKNTYYKLSIDVYTDLIDADEMQGVYIFITDDTYFEIQAIDTKKEWVTFEFYLEGNNFQNSFINVELWLGHGPSYIGTQVDANRNPRLTQGVALFDNVILEKIATKDDDNYSEAKTQFDSIEEDYFVRKSSLVFPDPGFTYYTKINSTTTTSSTTKWYYNARENSPQLYEFITGKEGITAEERPTVVTGNSSTYGIFDMSKLYEESVVDDVTTWVDTYRKDANEKFVAPPVNPATGMINLDGREPLDEFRALMLFHVDNEISGAGYKSNKRLAIETDTYYTISVWAYVWKPEYQGKEIEEPVFELTAPEVVDDPGEDASPEDDEEYQAYLKALEDYNKALEAHQKKVDEYNDYIAAKTAYEEAPAIAHFRLTGASVEGDLVQYTQSTDEWELLTFKVKGSQLSTRFVNLSFWLGEGVAGSSTLSTGGVFFDNISITVDDPDEINTADYTPVSALESEKDDMTGLIEEQTNDYLEIENAQGWEFKFAEGLSTGNALVDFGIVKGDVALDSARWDTLDKGLTIPGTKTISDEYKNPVNYNVLLMRNINYTATSLRYVGNPVNTFKEVLPNSFYRISMWVKNEGIDANQGLTINLLDANDIDNIKVLSSVNNVNVEDWIEVVFYVRGETFNSNSISIEFVMGKGDTFTPDDHLRGASFVTAIIMQNVDFREFNDSAAGDYVKKHTFNTTIDTSKTVTNGYFQNINYEDTVNRDSDAIDDEGNLVGVAVPQNWTLTEPLNSLDRPANLKQEGGKLVWDKVEYATEYEIYITNVEDTDGKMHYDILVDIVKVALLSDPSKPEWDYQTANKNYSQINGGFKVRAIANNHEEFESKDIYYGISNFSLMKKNENPNTSYNYEYIHEDDKFDSDYTTDFGVINSKHYADLNDKLISGGPLYPAPQLDDNGKFSYFSTKSDHLLMLSSSYYTRLSYAMSGSASLSANSYYEISVWVKTIGTDTQASITVSNTSNIFFRQDYDNYDPDVDGEYVGYVNQNTGDKWVKYTFYAETSVTTSTFKLELGLGNKYAKDVVNSDDKSVKGGLSKGTVFFDDITFKIIDKEDYQRKIKPVEAEGDMIEAQNEFLEIEEFFNNQYIYKTLIYTTDSFDIYTEVTSGFNGHTPKDYTHSFAPDAQTGDEKVSVRGVFKARDISPDHEYIYEGFEQTETDGPERPAWLPQPFGVEELRTFLTGYGDNVLFMANFAENTGQRYTSTTKTLSANTYYKISFFAKTMMDAANYAEFKFEPGNDTQDIKTIRINNEGKAVNELGFYEYTMYVYNSRSSSMSNNKISFHLGSKVAGSEEDNFFRGMLVIDNVSFEIIDADTYNQAYALYAEITDEELLSNATINFHKFEVTDPIEEDPIDTDPIDGDRPGWQFTDQMWLLISTIIIGAAIVAVLITVGARKIGAKYKKKEVMENKVDTAKSVIKESKKETSKKDINIDEYKD